MDNPTNAAPAADPKPNVIAALNARVTEAIAGSGTKILDGVVASLATREIDKRAAALLAGLEAANTTRSELNKLDRPDILAPLGRDRKPVGEGTYTKARLDDIEKAQKKLAKIERAIERATADKPDWSELLGLKGTLSGGDKPAESTEAS